MQVHRSDRFPDESCRGAVFLFRLVAVEGFERRELSFFRLARQILQSKSGIFGEKFNKASRKKGFLFAKDLHRNKSFKAYWAS
ncbi:MAG: hypothetical protein KF734_13220 [Saprospiraceae bacterium]|nr:hypothetical protein [Saprospiraceae bacterium]